MMPNELPSCPFCGESRWSSRGATLSYPFTQQGFHCDNCTAAASFISYAAWNVLTVFSRTQLEDAQYPDAWATWVGNVVLPTWRAYYEGSAVEMHDIPPQAPAEFYLAVWLGNEWKPVDPIESAKVPSLEEPSHRVSREFFAALLPDLAARVDSQPFNVEEIPNQYGPRGPAWITFNAFDATFVMGRRKRVWSMEIEAPQGIEVGALRARTSADRVTYVQEGPFRRMTRAEYREDLERVPDNSQWPDTVNWLVERHPEEGAKVRAYIPEDAPVAYKVIVHAWSREALVDYFELAIMGLRAVAAP